MTLTCIWCLVDARWTFPYYVSHLFQKSLSRQPNPLQSRPYTTLYLSVQSEESHKSRSIFNDSNSAQVWFLCFFFPKKVIQMSANGKTWFSQKKAAALLSIQFNWCWLKKGILPEKQLKLLYIGGRMSSTHEDVSSDLGPAFEVRPLSGKGMGMVAVRNIKRGSLVAED